MTREKKEEALIKDLNFWVGKWSGCGNDDRAKNRASRQITRITDKLGRISDCTWEDLRGKIGWDILSIVRDNNLILKRY